MLRFFRLNDPYRLLFVLAIVVVLGIKAEREFPATTLPELKGVLVGEMMADGKSLYSEVWDSMPPVAAYVQYVFDLMFDRGTLSRHIFTLFILFIQAAFFGILLINAKAFEESNYLPSLLFVILCFFSFDTITLTRDVVGSLFLLMALNTLFREVEFKNQRDETIHNLGFHLSMASLCVFSYLVFVAGTIVLLFLFTRVEVRRFILFMLGFLLPHLILNTWHFYYGSLDLFWSNFYIANFHASGQTLISIGSLFYLCLIPLIYFLLSLLMMRRDARLTKYQSQISQLMFFWFAFGLIEVWLTQFRTPQSFLVCVPPLAYFINHYLLLTRRKWIAETLLWTLLVGVVIVSSLSVRQMFGKIDYTALLVPAPKEVWKEKNILVLGENLSAYRDNSPAGYFLDWNLSKQVFENESYANAVIIAQAFEKYSPEIIIDPNNLMEKYWRYLPNIKIKYRKEGESYLKY